MRDVGVEILYVGRCSKLRQAAEIYDCAFVAGKLRFICVFFMAFEG